jgi:hypothetical protein
MMYTSSDTQHLSDLLELFHMEVGQATLNEEDTDLRCLFEDCFQVRTLTTVNLLT